MLLNANKENSEFKQMQKLLDNPEEKKVLDLIKYLSPSCTLVQKENEYGIQVEKNQHAAEYGLTVISKEDIKKELIKYNLIFYNSVDFTGEYDIEFVKKMNQTIIENRLNRVEGEKFRESLFFISERKPDSILIDGSSNPIKLALYKLPEKNGYYALLNKDSGYANLLNYYKGIKNYSSLSMRWLMVFEGYATLGILWFIACLFGFTVKHPIAFPFIMLVPSFISALIRMGLRKSHNEEFNHHTSYFLEYYNKKTNALS